MWVFLNNAFMSAVQARDNPDLLVVRARFAKDLKNVFPDLKVSSSNATDYRFRVICPKERFAQTMADAARSIDYGNFKNSVPERWRHDVYADVWSVMWRAQCDGVDQPGAGRKASR